LDVISRYSPTEAIFKKYDKEAGACICCDALFHSLQDVSTRYDLDLEKLLEELKKAAMDE